MERFINTLLTGTCVAVGVFCLALTAKFGVEVWTDYSSETWLKFVGPSFGAVCFFALAKLTYTKPKKKS